MLLILQDINNISQMEQTKQTISINMIKCPYGNETQLICNEEQCDKPAFLCGDRKCNCMKVDHFGCNTSNVDYIFNSIQKQRQKITEQTKQAIQEIQKIYDEMIDQISQAKAIFMDQVQQFGVKPLAFAFLNKIKDGRDKEITGQQVSKIKLQIKSQDKLMASLQMIQQTWKSEKQKFNKILHSLECFRKVGTFIIDSRIVQLSDQIKLKNFFQKSIYSTNLLFRASENGYKASDFHTKCDNIPNTLTIVQTQQGKIIGGFTPLRWKNSDYKLQPDKAKQTFLFSLTLNQKYPLLSENNGIKNDKSSGPMFGDTSYSDLKIGNNCKTEGTSYANFPLAYNNGKHIKGTEATIAFLGGSQTHFKISDYQVFEVKFLSEH